ncbi:hypothetical protein BV22DRAFT_1125075 [Leucogyrophana mollusca]|uniref:Uncharacterized protein n=1 Tax=Leucogyrophana mollusca TaxID=85980 RepID=A0ACB8BY55_9AGAM|nr:hypothetical protein BV22DRAFT_1125075 [Leucogyrophana mollusca]
MLARVTAVFLMFALAVVASPSAVARGGGEGSCDTEGGWNEQCCNPVENVDEVLALILGIDVGALIGVDCIASSTCDQTTICCTNDQQTVGLLNINVQCVNLV